MALFQELRSQMVTYICQSSKTPGGPAQCKPGPCNNLFIKRITFILLHHFSITIQPYFASFYATKYLKKLAVGEMLIEQIIEFFRVQGYLCYFKFRLRGPEPTGSTCTLATGHFYDKTKISKKFLRLDYYLLQNIAGNDVLYFPLLGQITKFNPQMQDFKRVWT